MTAQEKITRNEFRELHIGQTRIFTLRDAKKISSARVTAFQLKNEEGLEFDFKPDYRNKAVSVTRIK